MARKTKVIVIKKGDGEKENRDDGKAFLITEWSPVKSESWGIRGMTMAAKYGVDLGDGISGIQNIAISGIQALMRVNGQEVVDFIGELMECVQFIPDLRQNPNMSRSLIETDIDEVTTLLYLKAEAFAVITGFSLAELRSKLSSAMKSTASSAIPTSPPSSAPSSQAEGSPSAT